MEQHTLKTQEEQIQRARKGDARAFEELIQPLSDRLWRSARIMCHDDHAAGWLDEAEMDQLQEHLASCPACQREYEAAATLADLLGESDRSPAPLLDFPELHPSSGRLRYGLAGAAALAACLALLLHVLPPGATTIRPPAPPSVTELARAPASWATYRRATNTLNDQELEQILQAHHERANLYQPRMTLASLRATN